MPSSAFKAPSTYPLLPIGGILLDFGLLWPEVAASLDVTSLEAAGEPGTGVRDEKMGTFPSVLSLADRRPELRAELGPDKGASSGFSSFDPRGGVSLSMWDAMVPGKLAGLVNEKQQSRLQSAYLENLPPPAVAALKSGDSSIDPRGGASL